MVDLGGAGIQSAIFCFSRTRLCLYVCVWLLRKFLGVSKESQFIFGWEFVGWQGQGARVVAMWWPWGGRVGHRGEGAARI